jgi:hypothetical protein
MVNTRRTFLKAAGGISIVFPRAGRAAAKWMEKNPAEWNSDDLQMILNHSAWVREAPLELDKTEGGSPRKKTGAGQFTEFILLVRWESGLPVRQARRTGASPGDVPERYVISVSRIPLPFLGAFAGHRRGEEMGKGEVAAQFAATASIERAGKGLIRADNAQWITSDFSPRVDISFPRNPSPIGIADGDVTFSARIAAFTFTARFALKPMIYRGKLEL